MASASGVVGPLASSQTIFALIRAALRVRDHVLQRGGEEHRHVQLEELLVGDGLRARETREAARLLLVVDEGLHVEALGGCRRRPGSRRRPRASGPRSSAPRSAAYWPALPKPWMAMVLPFRSSPSAWRGLARHVDAAARGGVAAPGRAAEGDGLARDHAGAVLADDRLVLVHHPRHDLGGGVHVRGGHVLRSRRGTARRRGCRRGPAAPSRRRRAPSGCR